MSLTPLSAVVIQVPEASGLTIVGDKLWTINDDPGGHICEMTLAGRLTGRTIATEGDTEAVAYDGTKFIVAIETSGRILSYPGGEQIFQWRGNRENGTEGLAIDVVNTTYYLGNQDPPILATVKNGKLKKEKLLPWTQQISDLSYDQDCHCLWVLSAWEQKLYRALPDGELLGQWSLPFTGAEGITQLDDRLYIVTDNNDSNGTSMLYTFQKPK